jgi:hypothetical protein
MDKYGNMPSSIEKIPKIVFIVPYRNRVQQKFFFEQYMSFLMENRDDYEIYFSHQNDDRPFNRGATRNIGFLAVKNKYPEHYKNMSFVFNDVDTLPFNKIFSYETTSGIVKHYYGFTHLLGGIVVFNGEDFERINGYPNYWSWGNEDNVLQYRVEKNGLFIDRSQFYQIGSPQILQLFDGIDRIINRDDFLRRNKDTGNDGLHTLYAVNYTIDDKSSNIKDNIHRVMACNNKRFIININQFMTPVNPEKEKYYKYDLREPVNTIPKPDKTKQVHNFNTNNANWTNIPKYAPPKNINRPSLHIPRRFGLGGLI